MRLARCCRQFRSSVLVHNRAVAAILLAVALSAGAVFGQGHTLWQDGGVQLSGSITDAEPVATSDSAGGATVVWAGMWPDGTHAQRIDGTGVPLWAENGVLLCDSTGDGTLGVTSDGEHGVIAVWSNSGRPFAVQRVSAEGVPLWGSYGLTLRLPAYHLVDIPALVHDGHGGAIVAWIARPWDSDLLDTLIACRVDGAGNKKWETVVSIDTLEDVPPHLCPDGLGGVIIAWSNYSGSVHVQRVDSAGVAGWGSAGVLACTLSVPQGERACVAAGESLFVVGWFCGGNGAWQHRAQMLDLAGRQLWGLAGAPISGVFNSTSSAVGLSASRRGQSVWLWSENLAGTCDFFAQKLDSAGSRSWDTIGVLVGSSDTSQGGLSATVDDRGGAIGAWPLYHQNWDIYAQRVDSAGRLCWSDTGLAVCRDIYNQRWAPHVVTDGAGGAIVAWSDARGIFAQRVADGAAVEEAPSAEVRATNAGPTVFRGVLFLPKSVRPSASASSSANWLLDAAGRKVAVLHTGANDVSAFAPGVYFVRLESRGASHKPFAKVVVTK